MKTNNYELSILKVLSNIIIAISHEIKIKEEQKQLISFKTNF